MNNAGISEIHRFTDPSNLANPKWKPVLDIDLTSVIEGTQLALHYMRELRLKKSPSAKIDEKNESGLIINTASMAGFLPVYEFPVYVAAKHGVVGFTRSFGSKIMKEHGVRVVGIAPSFAETPLVTEARKVDKGILHLRFFFLDNNILLYMNRIR